MEIKKLIIASAGPLVNVIFGIIFYILKNETLTYINILIFIFNMLPIYPLDGGRIIKEIVSIFFGRKKALKFTYIISNISTVILGILILLLTYLTKNIAYLFILIYIGYVRIQENRKYKIREKIYKNLENYIAIKKD